MSVLSCDRRGCENIMCDRLSHEHGYLCDECFDELVELGATANIYQFMATRKYETDTNPGSYEYFNKIFELRY